MWDIHHMAYHEYYSLLNDDSTVSIKPIRFQWLLLEEWKKKMVVKKAILS